MCLVVGFCYNLKERKEKKPFPVTEWRKKIKEDA
jgi:hypothetical protein